MQVEQFICTLNFKVCQPFWGNTKQLREDLQFVPYMCFVGLFVFWCLFDALLQPDDIEIMSGIALMNLVPWCHQHGTIERRCCCSCFTITLCQFLTVWTIQIINSIYISMKIMKNYETYSKSQRFFLELIWLHFNQPHMSVGAAGVRRNSWRHQVTASIVEASLQSSELDRQEKKAGHSEDYFEMKIIVEVMIFIFKKRFLFPNRPMIFVVTRLQ